MAFSDLDIPERHIPISKTAFSVLRSLADVSINKIEKGNNNTFHYRTRRGMVIVFKLLNENTLFIIEPIHILIKTDEEGYHVKIFEKEFVVNDDSISLVPKNVSVPNLRPITIYSLEHIFWKALSLSA